MVRMDALRGVPPGVLWGILLCLTSVCAQGPMIEIPPSTTKVDVGGTVILACKVANQGMYTVHWTKNNKRISSDDAVSSSAVPSTRYSIVGRRLEGNYSLKITDVLTSDDAQFQCQLRAPPSGGNDIVSSPVNLIVQHPPGDAYPQCAPDSRGTVGLTVGQVVHFGCSTERGEPVARLNWTLDGRELAANISESTPGFITLSFARAVTADDNSKIFLCTLTHHLLPEPTTCQVGPLDVVFPPMETGITTIHPNPKPGRNLILFCQSTANSVAGLTYTWYVRPPSDAAEASQTGRITENENIFVLDDVRIEDDGTVIVCEASNELGSQNTSFTVSIFKETTPPPPPTRPAVRPTKERPPATSKPSVENIMATPYVIVLILIAVALLLLTVALIIFAFKRKKRPTVITISDLDNIHSDVHSLASFGNVSRHATPYMDRVDYELNRTRGRSHSRDMFDNVSLDSASALVNERSHSQDSPTQRKFSVDSLGKPLPYSGYAHRDYRRPSNGSPTHRPAKRLDSSPVKERKKSESAISQAGRPLPKIAGPVEQNEYAELTPISARKKYDESRPSVASPESGYGEDDSLIKPLNDSFPPHQSSNNCNCSRQISHVEV